MVTEEKETPMKAETHRDYSYHPYNLRPQERLNYFLPSPKKSLRSKSNGRRKHGGRRRDKEQIQGPGLASAATSRVANSVNEHGQALSEQLDDLDELQYPEEEQSVAGSETAAEPSYHVFLPFLDHHRASSDPSSVTGSIDIANLEAFVGYAVSTFAKIITKATQSSTKLLNTLRRTGMADRDLGMMYFETQAGKDFEIDALWDLPFSGKKFAGTVEAAMQSISSSIHRLIAELGIQLERLQKLADVLESSRRFMRTSSFWSATSCEPVGMEVEIPTKGTFAEEQQKAANHVSSSIQAVGILKKSLQKLMTGREELLDANPVRELDTSFFSRSLKNLKGLREGEREEKFIASLLTALYDSDS
ncbi:hypothetical protein V5O48_008113 [Marasmius crinis-equi]|uniref:Uncharacterized protein n=1 Tax=Marasmius crinis-equi TaxID=585013 RepID=A0ABR3FEU5_9AGAR